jgi:hypothetical protein
MTNNETELSAEPASDVLRSPRAFNPFRAGIVLEHQAPPIDRLAISTISPVRVYALELPAATALLGMKVVSIVVVIHRTATTITPVYGQPCRHFPLELGGRFHSNFSGSCRKSTVRWLIFSHTF